MHIFDKKSRRNTFVVVILVVIDLFIAIIKIFSNKKYIKSGECIVVCPAHMGDLVLASGFLTDLSMSDEVDTIYLLTQNSNFILRKYLPSKVVMKEFNHPKFVRHKKISVIEFIKEVVKLKDFFSQRNISNTFIPYVGYPSVIPWMFLIKNNCIAGFTNSGYSSLLDIKVNYYSLMKVHESSLGGHLLKKSHYVSSKYILNSEPKLIRTDHNVDVVDNRIIIHMGVGDQTRQWDIRKWKQLINTLEQMDYNVKIIVASTGELEYAKLILGIDSIIEIIDTKSNLELFEFEISKAKLIIGLESFAIHFASALGFLGIGIFTGIAGVERMRPLGKVITFSKKLSCSPCYSQVCRKRNCINDIEINEIIAKIGEI